MSPLIRAVIDTQALRANLRRLRTLALTAHVTAVVKANAYGHGLVPTALALDAADSFGVARIEEGIALRGHCIFWGVPNHVQPWLKEMNDDDFKATVFARGQTIGSVLRLPWSCHDQDGVTTKSPGRMVTRSPSIAV